MSSSAAAAASSSDKVPQLAAGAVLQASEEMPADAPRVRGYDFDAGIDYDQLIESFANTGFQATAFGEAVQEVNRMLDWSLAKEPVAQDEDEHMRSPEARAQVRTTVFLGCTSNLLSAGLRETVRFLVKHKMVHVLVVTAGGLEEDLIKCLAPHYVGSFDISGDELRRRGINRIGNLLVPNHNYCLFEDWLTPRLDAMLAKQKAEGYLWTPSRMLRYLGEEINDESSVLYWAAKNNIPVYSPALTDGSIGDMLFFHTYKNPGLVLDIVADVRGINELAMKARHTGCIILGGGLIKHHILNANLMRNGADHVILVNTAQESDGSDAGARPDEAVSWGKIKMTAAKIKVYADATLVFPLLVAQTFAKRFHASRA